MVNVWSTLNRLQSEVHTIISEYLFSLKKCCLKVYVSYRLRNHFRKWIVHFTWLLIKWKKRFHSETEEGGTWFILIITFNSFVWKLRKIGLRLTVHNAKWFIKILYLFNVLCLNNIFIYGYRMCLQETVGKYYHVRMFHADRLSPKKDWIIYE